MGNHTQQVTISGHTLTNKDIRRGLRISVAAGMCGMAYFAISQGIPMVMFMEALDLSGATIGAVGTIQQLAMVVQIPAALYASRLATRKKFWAQMALTHRIVWFIPPILALLLPHNTRAIAAGLLITVALSSIFAHGSAASWFSWLADLVPQHSSGRFWGTRQSAVMAVSLSATIIAGWILDASSDATGRTTMQGFALIFAIGAIFGTLDILIHLGVPEPLPKRDTEKVSFMKRLAEPLRNRDFLWLTLGMGTFFFSIGLVNAFAHIYLKREFAPTYTQISATVVTASIGTVLAGFILGFLVDRIGARAMAMILFLVGPAFASAWFFVSADTVSLWLPFIGSMQVPQPILLICAARLLSGGLYSGIFLCQLALLNGITSAKGRTISMAMHWSIVGVLGAMGPIAGGWIMDYVVANPFDWKLPLGPTFSFFHVLIIFHVLLLWIVCTFCLARVRLNRKDVPFKKAVYRLNPATPFRSASNVLNLYLMSATASSSNVAKAVRKLGHGKSELAVSDLIPCLDDPMVSVREETVFALARIGSPDAIDALVAKLDDPSSDLGAQIARALRERPSDRSIDALLRKLGDDDRETKAESVRTLGAIGDPRVSPCLLEVLRSSSDTRVISASGEALANLGEISAIYEMLEKMKKTDNPVLKQSMRVAIADLLGERGQFYAVLNQERRDRGIEAEKMLKHIRRFVRKQVPATDSRAQTAAKLCVRCENAYVGNKIQSAADRLMELAIIVAQTRFTIESADHSSIFKDLTQQDECFAIGFWYLTLLCHSWSAAGWDSRNQDDLLLGIYFLDTHTSA